MRKYVIFIGCFTVLLSSCIEPVEVEMYKKGDLLVVDGSIVAGAKRHVVKLSKSGPLNKRVFAPETDARVRLGMVGGNPRELIEVEPGIYEITGAEMPGIIDENYVLDIVLADGRHYQSQPERIPQRMLMDSLSFETQIQEIVNSLGKVINRKLVQLFVHSTIPDFAEGPYIRWEVEDIYKVSERLCGPMPMECYIYPPDISPPVNLLDGTIYSLGLPIQEALVARTINYSFGELYSFSVYQTAHTKAAFDYWKKLDQIVSLTGSIFDLPPATVTGNIFNVADPEELALGYFSAVSVDTAYLFLTRFDILDFEPVQPLCGIPGFPLNGAFNLACCNCLDLRYSTYERPDFW